MDSRCIKLFLVLALIACSSNEPPAVTPPTPVVAEKNALLITLSDYTTGKLAEWNLKQGQLKYEVPIHGDAVVRTSYDGKNALVINRAGADNLQIVDRATGAIGTQFSLGRSSNPQDLVPFASGKVWFTAFESNHIQQIDNMAITPAVDLSPMADEDGSAELARMAEINGNVWVQVGNLNRSEALFPPRANSKIVVINPETASVTNTFVVSPPNPVTDFKRDVDGNVYVGFGGRVGFQRAHDGGIVRFDPSGKGEFTVVITEEALGGDIVDFEITKSGGVAIIAAPHSKLVQFDLTTKAVRVAEEKTAYTLQQLLYDEKHSTVFLADRENTGPSIRVLNENLEENVAQKIPLSLPPYQMVFAP